MLSVIREFFQNRINNRNRKRLTNTSPYDFYALSEVSVGY